MRERSLDEWLCDRLTGIRKAIELMLAKLDIKFCMKCFNEIKGEAYTVEAKDVLGRPRRLTLCKKCYKEWKQSAR